MANGEQIFTFEPITQSDVTRYENQTRPMAPVTMDDMVRDFESFKTYKKLGAFDSDMGAGEMVWGGVEAIVGDTGSWLGTLPERIASNFGTKEEQAKGSATTLQIMGNIGLNWKTLGKGFKRLSHKLVLDEETEDDLYSSWQFWRDVHELEKKRQTTAADLAADDSFLFGGTMDPEIRELITSGKVQPDQQAAMGGSIWADPINYLPLHAAFKVARGTAPLRGAELALIKETQEQVAMRYALTNQAQIAARAGAQAPKGTDKAIAMLDGMIAENGKKIAELAPKRAIQLDTIASKLPAGHPLRQTIETALEGIPVKGRASLPAQAVGATAVVAGKTVENAGRLIQFLETLPAEAAQNFLVKIGIPEERAATFLQSGLAKRAAMGGGVFALADYFTEDEVLSLGAAAITVGLPTLARYGRDLSIAGRQLMLPETSLPFFKRLGVEGAEKLDRKLLDEMVDRDVLIPFKSTLAKVYGASEGGILKRALSPTGKLTPESQGIVGFLNKTKLGRTIEQSGRVTSVATTGGVIGSGFGYVAGGGEMPESTYGGLGAGLTLGFVGGMAGSVKRLTGSMSPQDITVARYGDYNYFTDNVLPAAQKEAFGAMSRSSQIAYANLALSQPDVQYNFVRKGRNADSGFYTVRDNMGYIEVNTDSPRHMEPVLAHEITHHTEQVGGTLAFNDMLIGNILTDTPGIFTARDKDGTPIKVGVKGDETNPLRFKTTEQFEKFRKQYASKLGIDDVETRNKVMTDDRTVREIVAEHGTDYFLNDPRRYRDLHEGPIGALMRNIVSGPLLNNVPFVRNFLAKLGGQFRPDGELITPNALFTNMQRLPQVTELLRKYNRQLEGLNPEIRKKKFPITEGEAKVKVTGAELAKNPELAELLRAGTFLRIDENGNVVPNLAMTSREVTKYNKRFTQAIVDLIREKEEKGGLPEGHVRETVDAQGRTSITGRFLDPSIIDALEARGTWNKEQIATLRRINDNLMNKGGNEFFLSYFKASSKRGKAGRYVNASVENLTEVPYGIELTQKGNLIIRTVSVDQLVKNVDKLIREQAAEVARLYGPDMNAAKTRLLQDLDTYHRNHAEGRPGEDGIGVDKKNLINSAFGQGRKEQADLNPWLAQLGKKQPRPVYRSRRIDRIGKADQLSGKRFVDYEKVARNLLPSGDELYLPPMSEAELTGLRNIIRENTDGFTVSLKGKWADRGFVVAPEKKTEAFITPNKFNKKTLWDYIVGNEELFDMKGSHLGGWYDKLNSRYALDVVFPIENLQAAVETALWGDQDAIFSLYDFKEIRTKDKHGKQIKPKGIEGSVKSILERKPDSIAAFASDAWRKHRGFRDEDGGSVLSGTEGTGKGTREPKATPTAEGIEGGRLLLPSTENLKPIDYGQEFTKAFEAKDPRRAGRHTPTVLGDRDAFSPLSARRETADLGGRVEDGRANMVTFTHFPTQRVRREVLKVNKHGTGIAGAERKRKANFAQLYEDRIYFGDENYRPETGLKTEFPHVVQVDRGNLWTGKPHYERAQFIHDMEQFMKENGVGPDPLGNGYTSTPDRYTAFEAFIKKQGFLGIYDRSNDAGYLFYDTKPGTPEAPVRISYDRAIVPEGRLPADKLLMPVLRDAVKLVEQRGRVAESVEETFFGKMLPKIFRKVGGQVKASPRSMREGARRAIEDLMPFMKDNPDFADFYDNDMGITRQNFDDYFGRVTDDEFLFFQVAFGLTSPGTKLRQNTNEGIGAMDLFIRKGNLDDIVVDMTGGRPKLQASPFPIGATSMSNKARTLKIFDRLIQEKGSVSEAVAFLEEAVPMKELNQFNREMGYSGGIGKPSDVKRIVKQATGQDKKIPRVFIFGPKVGAFTLNSIGRHNFNTIDVWEARFIRSYFRGMFDENTGLPETVDEHMFMTRFTDIFKEEIEAMTGERFDRSSLQASRWFFIIDTAKRLGYTKASTNDTVSGYAKQHLSKLGPPPQGRGAGASPSRKGVQGNPSGQGQAVRKKGPAAFPQRQDPVRLFMPQGAAEGTGRSAVPAPTQRTNSFLLPAASRAAQARELPERFRSR